MKSQKLKLFVLGLAIAVQALSSQAAIGLDEKIFLAEFRKVTGLQEGEFKVVSGPDSCQEGELQLIPIKSPQGTVTSYSLILGSSPLATDLGAIEVTTQERGVEEKSQANYATKSISWKKTQWRQNTTVTYETHIQFLDGGLNYSRLVKNGEKKIIDIKCRLTSR